MEFVSNFPPKVEYPDRLGQQDLEEMKSRIKIGWRLHEDFTRLVTEVEMLLKEKQDASEKRKE